MCENCGCSDSPRRPPATDHAHPEASDSHGALTHLDRLAERNRGFFRAKRVCVVNLLSFAASGAAALVARTREELGRRCPLQVLSAAALESLHALHTHAAPAAAAEADANLSLDAHLIGHALEHLDLDHTKLLLIENGGSAAAQAVNDLGEGVRVAAFSVREGAFKPLKFPLLFAGAAAVLITDGEQAAALGFDAAEARRHLAQVAPEAVVLEVSAATGAGLEAWYGFLEARVQRVSGGPAPHGAAEHAPGAPHAHPHHDSAHHHHHH